MLSRFRMTMIASAIASLAAAPGFAAVNTDDQATTADPGTGYGQQTAATGQMTGQEKMSGPAEDVQESAKVLEQLRQQDPNLASKVAEAKGVFIIPDYATASLLIGGSGGEGVLMTQQNGEWGNPGFYDIGNIDIGAQAGAAAGSIVAVLMTDKAVDNFRQNTDFSLTAQAGLTIVNWSAQAPATSDDGDVLVWSDTEGLLAEASVGVGGISWDEDEAQEYYNQQVTADQVLTGGVQNPHEATLQSEFAQFSKQPMSSEQPTTAEHPMSSEQPMSSEHEPMDRQSQPMQHDDDNDGDDY